MSFIPLAVLAGVLFATVIQMVEISSVRALLRATRGDAAILVATAMATIAFDLVTAVIIGMAIAGIYALRQVAKSARIDEIPLVDFLPALTDEVCAHQNGSIRPQRC